MTVETPRVIFIGIRKLAFPSFFLSIIYDWVNWKTIFFHEFVELLVACVELKEKRGVAGIDVDDKP